MLIQLSFASSEKRDSLKLLLRHRFGFYPNNTTLIIANFGFLELLQ